jgi:FlaG/FlaF family flagellin (archaellin)
MYRKAATLVCGVILIFALTSTYLCAQDYGTVSGTVTDPAGQPVPNAKVAIKNATTGPIEGSAN